MFNGTKHQITNIEQVSPKMMRCQTGDGEEICVLERNLSEGLQRIIIGHDIFSKIEERDVAWIERKGEEDLVRFIQRKSKGLIQGFICERPARENGLYGGRFFVSQLEIDFKNVKIKTEKPIPRGIKWPSQTSVLEQICQSCRNTVIKTYRIGGSISFLHVDCELPNSICCNTPKHTFTFLKKSSIENGEILIELASQKECPGVCFFPQIYSQHYRIGYEASHVTWARP